MTQKTVILLAVTMTVSPSISSARGGRAEAVIPLQTMSYDEASAADAVGTGCTWLGGTGGTRRLAMADNRAAVKLAGHVVKLKPAVGAPEVFPFTYHRWVGADLEISVRDTKRVVRRGGEYVETVAWLHIAKNGRTQIWRGRLNCGS